MFTLWSTIHAPSRCIRGRGRTRLTNRTPRQSQGAGRTMSTLSCTRSMPWRTCEMHAPPSLHTMKYSPSPFYPLGLNRNYPWFLCQPSVLLLQLLRVTHKYESVQAIRARTRTHTHTHTHKHTNTQAHTHTHTHTHTETNKQTNKHPHTGMKV
jgi:hypothetical protein